MLVLFKSISKINKSLLVLKKCVTYGIIILGLLSIYLSAEGQNLSESLRVKITKDIRNLHKVNSIVDRVKLYRELAKNYTYISIDSAAHYAEKGVKAAYALSDKHYLALSYTELGSIYDQMGKRQEAFDLLSKAEKLSKFYKDSTQAHVQTSIALFYNRKADYQKSMEYALRSVRYFEKLPHSPTLSLLYNTIGVINSKLSNLKEANFYFNKELEWAKKHTNLLSVARSLGNLGDLHLQNNDLTSAEIYTQNALQILNFIGNKNFISVALSNLGSIAAKRKNYEKAIKYHLQALEVRKQLASPIYIARSYLHLSECYLALNQNEQVLLYSKQAIDLFKSTQSQANHLQKGLDLQSKALANLKRFDEALFKSRQAAAIHDSLVGIEKSKIIFELQSSYDLERKRNQIILLSRNLYIKSLKALNQQKKLIVINKEKEAVKLKNQLLVKQQLIQKNVILFQSAVDKRQKAIIQQKNEELIFVQKQHLYYLSIVLLLLLLFFVVSYFLTQQQKAKNILRLQKEEIERQAELLATMNREKDRLFSIISHDLRSPIGNLKMGFYDLKTQLENSHIPLYDTSQRLERQVDLVLDLLSNLLEWSRTQLTGFQMIPTSVELNRLIEEEISYVKEALDRKGIFLINSISPGLKVWTDPNQLKIVIRNLINNSLKFTNPGGYIRISVKNSDSTITIRIKDTGVGMKPEQLQQLYVKIASQDGTLGEKGTGLGIKLCRDLILRQGGDFSIRSEENKGTLVDVTLPVYSHTP